MTCAIGARSRSSCRGQTKRQYQPAFRVACLILHAVMIEHKRLKSEFSIIQSSD